MARERTCDIAEKIKSLFGGTIPDLERLTSLDTDLWKLEMLRGEEKNFESYITYKKKIICGISKKTTGYISIDIDERVFERIIDFYEEEYEKQAKICEDIIAKMKGK